MLFNHGTSWIPAQCLQCHLRNPVGFSVLSQTTISPVNKSGKQSGEQDYHQENKLRVPNRQDAVSRRKNLTLSGSCHLSYTWEEEKKRSRRGMWDKKRHRNAAVSDPSPFGEINNPPARYLNSLETQGLLIYYKPGKSSSH